MKLYFDNGMKNLRLLGEYETEHLCFKRIDAFLKEKNYKSYYTRIWMKDEIKIIDVGCHSQFFEIHY